MVDVTKRSRLFEKLHLSGRKKNSSQWSRNGERFAALTASQPVLDVLSSEGAAEMDEALGVCSTASELKLQYLVDLDTQIRERLGTASAALVELFAAAPKEAEKRSEALQALHELRATGLQRVTALLPNIDQFLCSLCI